jgi:hypothetical protein
MNKVTLVFRRKTKPARNRLIRGRRRMSILSRYYMNKSRSRVSSFSFSECGPIPKSVKPKVKSPYDVYFEDSMELVNERKNFNCEEIA